MAELDRGVTTINGGATRLREAKAAAAKGGLAPVIDLTPRVGKTLDGREYVSVLRPRGRTGACEFEARPKSLTPA